jgi:hypothetical protein
MWSGSKSRPVLTLSALIRINVTSAGKKGTCINRASYLANFTEQREDGLYLLEYYRLDRNAQGPRKRYTASISQISFWYYQHRPRPAVNGMSDLSVYAPYTYLNFFLCFCFSRLSHSNHIRYKIIYTQSYDSHKSGQLFSAC